MTRALLILLFGFVPLAQAESVLPECLIDNPLVFHNCFRAWTFPNGNKYVGEWKDNKFHGQGTFTTAEGFKYVGEWKDSKHHGQGVRTLPDGQNYVGEWKDGMEHGQGVRTLLNGRRHSGYFMNGDFVPNICTDMGLRAGTSEHGQCVLKLMETVLAEDD